MYHVPEDCCNGRFGVPDEIPGLDEFLRDQPAIDEGEIDQMFIAEMERRDRIADLMSMHDAMVERMNEWINVPYGHDSGLASIGRAHDSIVR